MQKMKKSGEHSSFHNASPGNMQMASQEDFAWDENITGKASQRPLFFAVMRTNREDAQGRRQRQGTTMS